MNTSIKRLAETASKDTKKIIGLMSGTSLDGLDIALCEVRGSGQNTEVELLRFATSDYDDSLRQRLKPITSVSEAKLQDVCLLHSWLGNYHGELVLRYLERWEVSPSEVDCIGSHGQTIYHSPRSGHKIEGMPNATLQIGDGDHLATRTGIVTVSDFRQKHTAAGGEGAPLAALVDELLFSHPTENRILLNIGGIANFTFLPAGTKGEMLASDTGPGNTLIDAATRNHFSKAYDEDGEIARKGKIDWEALQKLKSDPYFGRSLPKTTGPEYFNLSWAERRLREAGLGLPEGADLVATLTRLTAETIAEAIENLDIEDKAHLYVSGGGAHNTALVTDLNDLLGDTEIHPFETLGFDADAKEALVFAVLANELLSGEGFKINGSPNGPTGLGKISFPH